MIENSSDQINTKGHKFTGGTKLTVRDIQDAQNILREGNKNRHVRPTKMNTSSSRSHAIYTIHTSVRSANTHTISALNLVDLAGTEGVRRTGHQGAALIEGVHINQGLLSIGKVLQALSSGSKIIPYRDSVLSLVLQGIMTVHSYLIVLLNIFFLDSLNLNSYLTLLACVSPLKEDVSETLATLRFAQNSKAIHAE